MIGIDSFQELQPNEVLQDLLNLIDSEIGGFVISDEFSDVLKKKKNETQHTTSFCLFMIHRSNLTFVFLPENAQKGSHKGDIGVYKGSSLVFIIEAKVLPTPKDSKRKEYEYVYGKGGGIQRFKDGDHGVNNIDEPLSENGMIAFVKQHSFEHWLEKINTWILDAGWTKEEQLQQIYCKDTAKLHSKHIRQDESEVFLHHFWVNVLSKPSKSKLLEISG